MSRNFLPSKDAELLAWSSNFSTTVTSLAMAVGVSTAQATAYAALHTAFASALATATEPSTRTRATIAQKDSTRAPLIANARLLGRVINAFPATTNAQRINLGLTPRSGSFTPINPPTESPVLKVVSANGRILKISLSSAGSERRAKPNNVQGASIFSFVGSEPPADISLWKFEGSTTRTTVTLEFPPTVPAGSQVWITGFWFSPRSQSGPACMPVSAYIAGGVSGTADAPVAKAA